MIHLKHTDPDLPPPALPRRRVLQYLLGGTLTLAGLVGCGGAGEDEGETDEAAEEEEGNEEEPEEEEEED